MDSLVGAVIDSVRVGPAEGSEKRTRDRPSAFAVPEPCPAKAQGSGAAGVSAALVGDLQLTAR